MSYEPSAHTIQMTILKQLLLAPAVSFAQLQRVTELTSDHFNFHIRQLQTVGYVRKTENGQYTLTPLGKEYANRMDTDQQVIEKQAKVAVALIIEDDQGRFLAQQRLKQPYYGFWGRPTGKIRWGETVLEAAARELMEETGVTAELEFKGIYHKMDYRRDTGEMLEDKYFYLVHGIQPQGRLLARFDGGENHWLTNKEILAKEKVFPKIIEISELIRKPGLQFIECKHDYDNEEY